MFRQTRSPIIVCTVMALVIIISYLQQVNTKIIRLKLGKKSADNETCLEEMNNVPCKTLEYIAKEVQSNCTNITIQIETKSIAVHRELIFKNCSDLSIISNKKINIWCRNDKNHIKSTGFIFKNIRNLLVRNLKIISCSSRFRSSTSTAALQVHNSVDVTFDNVHFDRARGTAMVINNTFGMVSIKKNSFHNNKLYDVGVQNFSYPGGIHIEFTRNESAHKTKYRLTNCSFINNTAPKKFTKYAQSRLVRENDWSGQGLGGGLGIIFTGVSSGIHTIIESCNFKKNFALSGGGIYIHYQNRTENNTVIINSTHFEENEAAREGGAISIGYLQLFPCNNKLQVINCTFFKNIADSGGAISMLAVHTCLKSNPGQSVMFQNCRWLNNTGKLSSAVDIAPIHFDHFGQGFLPVLIFKNCTFINNALYRWRRSLLPRDFPVEVEPKYNSTDVIHQYSGVFTITKATVVFEESIVFTNNLFTALHTHSGTITFSQKTKVEFNSNYGLNGAAIAMYGFSSLIFNKDSSFVFINNTASGVGGAIYFESFDQKNFLTRASQCFLQYNGSNSSLSKRNVTFTFRHNKAEAGTSIYASSFYPCFFEYFDSMWGQKVISFFQKIASFSFDNKSNALATNGRYFTLIPNQIRRKGIIPGKETRFSLKFNDEFEQTQKTAYTLSVAANSSVTLDPEYTVNTSTKFYGEQSSNFTFFVSAQDVRRVSAVIQMTLLPCPPGFYFNNDSMACECAADNPKKAFVGITRCQHTDFYAYIQFGFWSGYGSSNNFYTAMCPLRFCALTTNAYDPRHLYALPNSSANLNNVMCGSNRKGILCSECQENKSVYYHSSHFACRENRLCKLGFLFYILSEILPTIILFTVIIAFNISFTSGNINGLILFSQVLDTITLNVRLSNNNAENAIMFFNTIYGVLNLRFFNIETLSFCLWEGATVMDMLTFKYVTIIIAFLLVIALIVLMNSNVCTKLHQKLSPKQSIIHGLSAFLFICYTECTKISFYILTRVVLKGEGGTSGPAVTFFGGIPYFKGKHLIYVFPAVICLVIITIIPPVLLFMYPLVYQLLSLCGLSEHYIVTKVSNVIAIHKLMPIFDSFQSCYKDKLRFFAGLYFMYRVAILLSYSISKSVTLFHIIVGFLLFVIMGIHSMVNPYKKSVHNRIDSLIFLNLAIINALTLLSIVYAIQTKENPDYVHRNTVLTTISMVQMFMIGIPIVCFIFWALFNLIKRKLKKKKNTSIINNSDLDDFQLMRDLDENENDNEQQYFELTDSY